MNENLLSTDRPIELYYALLTEINSFQKIGDSQCTVGLTGEWKKIRTTIGTISMKETPRETRAGQKFITELTAICPGHSKATVESVETVRGKKVILKAVYRSGKEKIIGNNQSGPKLFFTTNSNRITERRLQVAWEHVSQNLYHT